MQAYEATKHFSFLIFRLVCKISDSKLWPFRKNEFRCFPKYSLYSWFSPTSLAHEATEETQTKVPGKLCGSKQKWLLICSEGKCYCRLYRLNQCEIKGNIPGNRNTML